MEIKIVKIWYVAVVLIHFGTTAFSQSLLTNNFPIGLNRGGEGILFKHDSTFLCFGGMVRESDMLHGVYVATVDYGLNPVQINQLEMGTEDFSMNNFHSVIRALGGGYFGVFSLNLQYPYLCRFDENGDTLWTKKMFNDSSTQYADYVLTQSPDSSLYLAGIHIIEVQSPWKHVIAKFDKDGDYLWHTETTHGINHWPQAILLTNDAIVVGGSYYENQSDVDFGRQQQYQAKFDLSGELIWLKTVEAQPIGSETGIVGLEQLDNGNYLYGASRTEGISSQEGQWNNTDNRPVIGELNALTGDVVWETGFGEYLWEHRFLNFKKTSDGGYIGVGQHIDQFNGPSGGWPIGMIIRFDSQLNMVWYRSYVPEIWEGTGRRNNLSDIVENENGTFTAIGLIFYNPGNGQISGWAQNTYMITVNEHGCLVAGCETGIREVEHEDAIVVYPNPAKDQLNVSLGDYMTEQWQVINLTGSVVLKGGYLFGTTAQINIDKIVPGVYTFCITTKDGQIRTSKFVKN